MIPRYPFTAGAVRYTVRRPAGRAGPSLFRETPPSRLHRIARLGVACALALATLWAGSDR